MSTAVVQAAAKNSYQVFNEPSPTRVFYPVNGTTLQRMQDLQKIFNDILVPLYGSQEKALKQINLSEDRLCYLLYENQAPVGVIVFKTIISNEFSTYGITKSIEIKSLFVVASGENSGRGIGSLLLDKVASEVERLKIKCDSIHVTVSETKGDSLNFFRKKGFHIVHTWSDRYIKGTKEHLLRRLQVAQEVIKQSSEEQVKQKIAASERVGKEAPSSVASSSSQAKVSASEETVVFLTQQQKTAKEGSEKESLSSMLSKLSMQTAAKEKEAASSEATQKTQAQHPIEWSPKVLTVVKNAHWNDIHALKLLSDGTFVSGSKDNTLRKWNQNGEVVREVYDVEPMFVSERDWITAIGVINDEYWISGNRAGRVSLWNTAGDYIKDLPLKLPKGYHVSNEANQRRINCLVGGTNKQKPSFFVGFPTMFSEFNVIEGRTVLVTPVHNNDWVYCIHPLNERRNLVVTAGTLEVWEKAQGIWNRGATVYTEKKEQAEKGNFFRGRGRGRGRGSFTKGAAKKSRCHISALTQLNSANHFALGIFGGYTAVVNIETGNTVREWKEHTDNVWCIENVTKEVFASSSSDRTIKFWDTRFKDSVKTIKNHVGGVSAMLKINENVLVAGTCPENPKNEGGQLLFYDIRRS